MKRRLIVMRHAKSSWSHAQLTDHERPLNKRGRRDAPQVASFLKNEGWIAQRVISSTSQRTRETWDLMSPIWNHPPAEFTRALYLAGSSEVREALLSQDSATSIMILGHNPGWSEVSSWLSGLRIEMTTANAVLLSVEAGTWREAFEQAGSWTLHDVIRPREITP